MFGLVLEPAQLLGFVGGRLRADESRPQPVDLFFFVVLVADRTIRCFFVHCSFLNDAHDGFLWRGLGDVVGATVTHNEKGLL